jgi:hypothetical protein
MASNPMQSLLREVPALSVLHMLWKVLSSKMSMAKLEN